MIRSLFVTTIFILGFLTTTLANTTSALTLAEWDQLDQDDKSFITEGYGSEYSNVEIFEYSLSPDQNLDIINSTLIRQFVDQMLIKMDEESHLEVEDDYYAMYGDTFLYNITVAVLDGNTILGGSLSYIQYGCVMPDESSPYFTNEDDAIAAGCDVKADVSWQSHGSFNYDLEILNITGYMEWSGH